MYLEFTKRGTDKGVGVKKFADLMGVDMNDTIAMGDEENDIPMIKACGVGVAVKNAVPDALKAAEDNGDDEEEIKVQCVGAPRYRITVKSTDYILAEKELEVIE